MLSPDALGRTSPMCSLYSWLSFQLLAYCTAPAQRLALSPGLHMQPKRILLKHNVLRPQHACNHALSSERFRTKYTCMDAWCCARADRQGLAAGPSVLGLIAPLLTMIQAWVAYLALHVHAALPIHCIACNSSHPFVISPNLCHSA